MICLRALGAAMTNHYRMASDSFTLFMSASRPAWRKPQLGGLGALVAHWSLPNRPPAVVSIPTGSGKSAIATAAPYLIGASRVLVVVPSKDVRRQLASEFETERVLQSIGARGSDQMPAVREITGFVNDWNELSDADVVVGIPASISPVHYPDNPPPADFFDLIVIDEAHHTPAPTWRAILDHFPAARSVLLTATPTRRDGKRVPGDVVFHYPLRQALDDGIYKPVEPRVLDLGPRPTQEMADRAVIEEVIALAAQPEHADSTILIRTSSIERAKAVAQMYGIRGLPVVVLSSRLSTAARDQVVSDLRAGTARAVAVVDMLGEGFDLPRIRIAAYHDKHKSANATVQLIGRLARVDSHYPQPSIMVTAKDQDVFPQLRGLVRSLWEEDADWATVLPGVIDDEVRESIADRDFANRFVDVPPEMPIEALRPLVRAIIYEVSPGSWEPVFIDSPLPEELAAGQLLRGKTIFYSGVTPTTSTLMIVTASRTHPKWLAEPGLDSSEFELHLFSWSAATTVGQPHVFIVNSTNLAVARDVMEALGAVGPCRLADPGAMQEAFESIDRSSVSNVGVRNTYMTGRGNASYRTYAGSGVDRGMRAADMTNSALGHAMAQVADGTASYNIGIATGKAKYWESRYVRLREYENAIDDFVSRFRVPPSAGGPGQLLPTLARGERLESFPTAHVVAVELNTRLRGREWQIGGEVLDALDFYRTGPDGAQAINRIELAAVAPRLGDTPVWRGWQDVEGVVHEHGQPVEVKRGFGSSRSLADLLTDDPLSIYFGDGTSVFGATYYKRPGLPRDLPPIRTTDFDWSPFDITVEPKAHVKTKPSVHHALEQWLESQPHRLRHRWIFLNDGKGELADYVVIEAGPGPRAHIGLWHAKASGGSTPSVRVTDLQEVGTQAFKSRRWAGDAGLWTTLRRRYLGLESPTLNLLHGRARLFEALCGNVADHPRYSFDKYPPAVTCEIGIVQPGLSYGQLQRQMDQPSPSLASQQARDILTVCHDAIADIGELRLIASP